VGEGLFILPACQQVGYTYLMSIWADRRKQTIIWCIIFLVIGVIAIAAWTVLHKPATCSDRKQNQHEEGVDCGGECSLMCKDRTEEPIVLWQRFFKVSDGIYTVATMIQNPNLNAYAPDVPYRIRIYDDEGVTIFEREGYTTIYAKYAFPLIEASVRTGERIPVRMTFEFIEKPMWYRSAGEIEEMLKGLAITNDVILNELTSPRISAIIRNDSNVVRQNVKIAALVYNADGNVMAVSQTFVDQVPSHGTSNVVFSWPEPFPAPILKKELIILPY
jgi:hypothetical protein